MKLKPHEFVELTNDYTRFNSENQKSARRMSAALDLQESELEYTDVFAFNAAIEKLIALSDEYTASLSKAVIKHKMFVRDFETPNTVAKYVVGM